MSPFYCPCCGVHQLTPMPQEDRYACMGCRHVFDIVDVIAKMCRQAGIEDRMEFPLADGRTLVSELRYGGEQKGGDA